MIQMDEIIRQLTANAQAIRAMLVTLTQEQAQWKPDAETWSLQETMMHIYNEERIDFRKHLQEMLSVPPQPWQPFRKEDLVAVSTCREALEAFLAEREHSIAWLQALQSPDWETQTQAPWGGMISAGDVLVSWVAHDYLHMRQLNEVLYALNMKQSAPNSVDYAGDW
jgi:uncharacterized damage-inducible protein DinB